MNYISSLLIVSVDEQKFFILMKSNLVIFYFMICGLYF